MKCSLSTVHKWENRNRIQQEQENSHGPKACWLVETQTCLVPLLRLHLDPRLTWTQTWSTKHWSLKEALWNSKEMPKNISWYGTSERYMRWSHWGLDTGHDLHSHQPNSCPSQRQKLEQDRPLSCLWELSFDLLFLRPEVRNTADQWALLPFSTTLITCFRLGLFPRNRKHAD